MGNLPEVIAAFAFFGAVVICPLVYLMMRHQRTIAELQHRSGDVDTQRRLEALEHEVRALRAAEHARILADEDRQGLGQRIS